MVKEKTKPKAKPKAKPEPQAEPKPTFSLDKALAAISERAAETPPLSEGIGRVDPNTPEVERRRYSRQLEAAILVQIAGLQKAPDSELKTTRLNVALDRLGELRAEQGDYVGAITFTKDGKRRAHLEKIQDAIERAGEGKCDCPTFQVRDGREIATLSPRFKTQTIQTQRGPRNLILCAMCKKMYVK